MRWKRIVSAAVALALVVVLVVWLDARVGRVRPVDATDASAIVVTWLWATTLFGATAGEEPSESPSDDAAPGEDEPIDTTTISRWSEAPAGAPAEESAR